MNPPISIQEAETMFGDEIENLIAKIINNTKAAFVLRVAMFVDLQDNFPIESKIENVRANLHVSARTRAINYINHNKLIKDVNAEQTFERP